MEYGYWPIPVPRASIVPVREGTNSHTLRNFPRFGLVLPALRVERIRTTERLKSAIACVGG